MDLKLAQHYRLEQNITLRQTWDELIKYYPVELAKYHSDSMKLRNIY